MTPYTVAEVLEGIAAAVEAVPGVQVKPYLLDNPSPPTVMLTVDEFRYHGAFGLGNPELDVIVTAVVSRVVEGESFASLYRHLDAAGDDSLRAALESDPTFGGVAQTSVVTSGGRVTPVDFGGVLYLACEWDLRVHVASV